MGVFERSRWEELERRKRASGYEDKKQEEVMGPWEWEGGRVYEDGKRARSCSKKRHARIMCSKQEAERIRVQRNEHRTSELMWGTASIADGAYARV